MSAIILRPDQAKLKSDIYAGWQSGHRNMLAVLPTGGGKSVIVSDVILDGHQQGLTEAVIAHRNELVGQMSLHIARRGIKHRIIASKQAIAQITAEHRLELGRSFVNPDGKCSVVSVDTLNARAEQLKQWALQVSRWTVDEAHHVLRENKWGRAVGLFKNAWGLGVTASPRRADGMGLGDEYDGVFHDMCLGPDMRTLINMGALCDYEIAIPESDFEIDDGDLAPSGDWSTAKMREASKRSHIVGDVVTEYMRRALGKCAICFATDVETANEMADRFNAAGIPAASVSAKTATDARNEYIRRFRDGRLHVLVNVDLFGEGFDVPAVEVVIMARPTASLAVYLQQFGRALRTLEGKAYGLVIDHVSNWKRHGFPDKAHYWSLARREKRGKKEIDPEDVPLTSCRSCSRPYERAYPKCPYCGAEPPLPEPGSRTPQSVDGDLILLDRAMLEQMRAAIELESPASMSDRVAYAAGPYAGAGAGNRQVEKIQAQQALREAIEQWAGIQRAAGRDDQQSYRRFYLATGVDVLSALALDDRAKYEELAGKVRGWYGAEPVKKKSIEQQLIEEAIERGEQGFRGGWIEVGKASELVNSQSPITLSKLITSMGYVKVGKKSLGNDEIRVLIYSDGTNLNHEDFWAVNEYYSEPVRIMLELISSQTEGFKDGWISLYHLNKHTNRRCNVGKELKSLGFHFVGQSFGYVEGEKISTSLYHTNADADPADFWMSNGYESVVNNMIENDMVEGGWLNMSELAIKYNLPGKTVNTILTGAGFYDKGDHKRQIDGNFFQVRLFNRNPDADPADFWVSKGYV